MIDILTEYNVLGAFVETLKYTVLAAIGSLVIGTLVAVMRVSPIGVLRGLGTFYVTTIRNTPLTLLMVLSILGLAFIVGLQLSEDFNANTFRWAVVMLSVYHAAFVAEALRSGVNTVPTGQAEAARSIGLTFGQSLREVILPQAFRGAIAPLGSTLIALMGQAGYDVLVEHCEARVAALTAARAVASMERTAAARDAQLRAFAPHPADPS